MTLSLNRKTFSHSRSDVHFLVYKHNHFKLDGLLVVYGLTKCVQRSKQTEMVLILIFGLLT